MAKLYYSIGEVAQMLEVNPSLLRYWETEFDCIRPQKNSKGTRTYTIEDINILKRIHHLTKDCGFTLEGAREQIKSNALPDEKMEIIQNLNEIRSFLIDLKNQL